MPRYREDIDQIPSYVPGKPIDEVARELGIDDIVKLASNEFPLAPFPEVQAAIAAAAASVNRYPEDSGYQLSRAVASHHGVPADHIWLGAGSTQLIRTIAAGVGGPATATLYAWPSFIGYRIGAAMASSRRIEVPLDTDGRHDLDAMAAAVTEDTTLVFVCNPNNPTGTLVAHDRVTHLMDSLPASVLVVVDEAYHEFAADPAHATQVAAAVERPNVIVLRTFSKVHGLAGLRIGYAVTRPATISALRHLQLPFVVNSVAQAAALASLAQRDRLEERIKANATGREYLETALDERGLRSFPSQTNFIAFTPPESPGDLAARMLREGVIVRPLGSLLRVTVGLEAENRRFVAALDAALALPGDH